jgi:ubiquinone/menaquinone biosynthesis C-methylase UbiE
MNVFKGAASYYDRYRPGLPQSVADYLCEEAGKHTTLSSLLDVGTGTGQVIEALLSRFQDIIGLDVEPEMLDLAGRKFDALPHPNSRIRFYCGRIEDFSPPVGWRASLVTFNRSFHWMERDLTLRKLEGVVEPGGVVAVMSDTWFGQNNEWQVVVKDVLKEFLGKPPEHVGLEPYRPFADTLQDSPFNEVTPEVSFPITRTWSYETILGFIYSTSRTKQSAFGKRLFEFEERLRETLARYSTDDAFIEEDRFSVTLGSKSASLL